MALDLFTPEDTAVLLIDHQVGTMSWIRSAPVEHVKANAVALAAAATALGMPLVLTSSLEEQRQGPLIAELRDVAPREYESRVRRSGMVNAMEDPDFAAAVTATGRSNLVIAGVTNDVCTVYPTLSALREGYRVQVVADAGGSMSAVADDIAVERMRLAGAGIASTNMVLTELARDWSSPAGQSLIPIVGSLIPQGS
ncbi:isochorismatase family protein [Saccharothrix coeruleofusca]|uniref:Isochorismatase n=1 Tax=Saccharothrix coeruleofusca TaxID=33919 RepID=A0A918EFF3_9PSEU|nr:isochorismatase family protein [Saccharothrix coeruleofusca]MBP2334841.1 nicotinamidase-related amidase [Saccharothrix coeruleofusca]GGP73821.1 isochorismatase [Saccharothrix coeruleofusca]